MHPFFTWISASSLQSLLWTLSQVDCLCPRHLVVLGVYLVLCLEHNPVISFHLGFSFFLFYFLKNLWLPWVFSGVCRLSQAAESGDYSLAVVPRASRRGGFSRLMGFRSCRMRAQQLWLMGSVAHGMQNLSAPGTKPAFPALVGGFLSTVPPGKSLPRFLFVFLGMWKVIYVSWPLRSGLYGGCPLCPSSTLPFCHQRARDQVILG